MYVTDKKNKIYAYFFIVLAVKLQCQRKLTT